MQIEVNEKPARAIVAAVQLPGVSDVEFESSLIELRELAKTLGFELVGTFTQKRDHFDTTAYLGIGKRQEMRRFVESEPGLEPDTESTSASGQIRRAAKSGAARAKEAAQSAADPDTRRADIVLVDHEISPSQARNLEIEVGCEVMDRTMVILEIFHRHARSRAARAQVEIARLGYMAPRLREAAKLAGPKGRQRSGTGGRGAGEAHSELDRQKIRNRIAELQEEIKAMDVERQTQRARRQERQGLARVALVGYTNAGKSTLMRALTGSEVLVANKLFATLDTTVRALHPESVPRVLVSDTVGFIKNLPHDLVASFKSTLEEAAEASLLLHVIDASDPGFERQLAVTDEVLREIGAQAVPRIRIFNKIDCVGEATAQAAHEATLRIQYPDCMVMSARREGDIAKLREAVQAFFQKDLVEVEFFLPWSAQQMRGEIFASCEVLEERADNEGTFFRVRSKPETLDGMRERVAQTR
ncbi:MAG: GTPase HflX [Betaproteobacteria bacterium]|jgi:GTP-binding protein HflX